MDKLKSSIEEANQAIDKEKEKNVSLLHLIFPPNIAEKLWLGTINYNILFLNVRFLLFMVFFFVGGR